MPPEAAPAPAPADPSAAANAAAPSQDSLFTQPAAAAPAAAPAPQDTPPGEPKPAAEGRPDWLPEKYAVLGADGKLDLAASSQKLADGYSNAVKRIGTGDLPPESPDAYKDSPIPDEFKDVPLDPELTRSFRERAHKAGLTQSQLDFVMGEYFGVVPSLLNAQASFTADQARAELSKVWSNPAELQANMTHAERAVSALPGPLAQQVREKYGTDPLFWQFAAQYGREVGEDRSPQSPGAQATATDVDALMRTDAYRNPKNPDHAKVSAQVREAFEKRFGTAPAMA